MLTSEVTYLGNLRTEAVHIQSGTRIITDAPKDNQGKGEAFSPTDLLATSLASCMLTIMGILANTHQIDINGAKARITKVMGSNPRKVKEVIIDIDLPKSYSEKEKQMLENAGRSCPVALSLDKELIQTLKFNFK